MPDSLRDLLRQRAAESGGPSAGLTEGSLHKARGIARRRFAAVAAGAAAGLAIAGMAAGAIILPDDGTAPPAEEPTTDEPADPTTAATYEPDEEAADCGRPSEDWSGWGDSDSIGPMTELPQALFVEFEWTGERMSEVWRYEDGGSDSVIAAQSLFPAPDGDRYVIAAECASTIGPIDAIDDTGALIDLGVDSLYCAPVWSPDSNSVVLTVPSPEYDERYVLDVATGGQTELPEEVSCQPRWSGDGEYLVSTDGAVAMRPDGTGRTDLAGVETEEGEFASLSSVSADLDRACFQIDTGESASSGHVDPVRCDRYVDTATGAELDLPGGADGAQVVFLADGGMIIGELTDEGVEVSLFDDEGQLLDDRVLDHRGARSALLTGYYTE